MHGERNVCREVVVVRCVFYYPVLSPNNNNNIYIIYII